MPSADRFDDPNTPFPRGPRATSTRERIIQEALTLIANQGAEGFSLNEVLRRAEVTKGSFFHFFRNLDALCLECFERCKAMVHPELDPDEFSSLEALLLAFGAETLERTQSRQFVRLLMFFGARAMNDERYRRVQIELTELYLEAVAGLVLTKAPGLDPERVREAVAFLLIVNQGIASHRVLFEDAARMARVWPYSVKAALALMGIEVPTDPDSGTALFLDGTMGPLAEGRGADPSRIRRRGQGDRSIF